MTVYLCGKAFNVPAPNKVLIATVARLDATELEPELSELVDKRYLSTVVNTYGDLNVCYKLGSMGGTLMRHMASAK